MINSLVWSHTTAEQTVNANTYLLTSTFKLCTKCTKRDHPQGASKSLYRKMFYSLNLKFHHPKKDTCGLCETYNNSDEDKKKQLQLDYQRHIGEKEKVRVIKGKSKEKASRETTNHNAAVFDLFSHLSAPVTKVRAFLQAPFGMFKFNCI